MAINKKLIHFKKKENFNTEVANGNILDNSIVFIQDSKEISTHGTIYKSVNWSVLKPELYQWVDLGLPSGTLWADRNVGASNPEDAGLYFAWSEALGYTIETDAKKFTWGDYEHSIDGSLTNFSKYNGTDNNTLTDTSEDGAYLSDNTCNMPNYVQVLELVDNTTGNDEILNNIKGIRVTSNINGNSIFIPYSGYISNGALPDYDIAYLWSDSLNISNVKQAAVIKAYNGEITRFLYSRCVGCTIRPIKD